MDKLIASCIDDMRSVDGTLPLAAQIRVYDLLQALSEAVERGIMPSESISKEFCAVYEASAEVLEKSYDEAALKEQIAALK